MIRFKRKRKRRFVRRKRRSYTRSRSGKPEVKYTTIFVANKGIPVDRDGDTYLSNTSYVYTNVFNAITKGTAFYNRIGNKIFVKNIIIKTDMWTCGYSHLGTRYDVNTAMARIIVNNTNFTNSTLAFFAPANGGLKFLCPVNRKNYTVHHDKVYRLSSGYPNDNVTTSSSHLTGDLRRVTINMKLNRYIDWNDFTDIAGAGTEGLTDHKNYFSIAALSQVPREGFDNTTPICSNWMIRIYFTDA